MGDMKNCKRCKAEMKKKDIYCPVCKKKQNNKALYIIAGFVVLAILSFLFGSGEDAVETVTKDNDPKTEITKDVKPTKKPKEKPTEKPIEYTKYDVSEMLDDLDSNAMKAEKKYQDQYVEITGRLSNIDSDGKYISLEPSNDEFTLINVQCFMKSDEQKEKVMEMSKGDTVTIKGKVKSIGEVLGYTVAITEID